MSVFLRIFKHLLPTGRAWRITTDKPLRWFFEALATVGEGLRQFADNVWLDVSPSTTRELDAWEEQFAIYDKAPNEAARRARLAAAWQAVGGQDPKYLQETLRAAGFDVYIHEWWEPGTVPAPGSRHAAVARNPLLWLRSRYGAVSPQVECGEPDAACGETWAAMGNGRSLKGYPLVNKVFVNRPDYIVLCGEPLAACGEPTALTGNYKGNGDRVRDYYIPSDPSTWPYFLYIGGQEFGTLAEVPETRRAEFEALALKISPLQQWLGILVEFT